MVWFVLSCVTLLLVAVLPACWLVSMVLPVMIVRLAAVLLLMAVMPLSLMA